MSPTPESLRPLLLVSEGLSFCVIGFGAEFGCFSLLDQLSFELWR